MILILHKMLSKYYGEKWSQLSTIQKKVQLSTMAIKVRSRSIELKLVLKKLAAALYMLLMWLDVKQNQADELAQIYNMKL